MKQKDIALIVVIAFISVFISLFVSRLIFVKPANRQQKVEVVQPISANMAQPDSAYFNSQAFDPTQPITVTQNANPDPFSGAASSQ